MYLSFELECETNENKQKEAGIGPFKKILSVCDIYLFNTRSIEHRGSSCGKCHKATTAVKQNWACTLTEQSMPHFTAVIALPYNMVHPDFH